MLRLLLALAVLLAPAWVAAEPLRAVVRHAGGDELVLARLDGQIVDLDVEVIAQDGELEADLDRQIAAARQLADDAGATAVLWFSVRGGVITVVVATPSDRRVFLRDVAAGDDSATAEAAAQVARSALRALALGGTIGVAQPEEKREEEPAPRTPWRWRGALGWQAALDGGADVGAHAALLRIGASRGPWGGAIALGFGVPLRRDGEITVELARWSALAIAEHRRGAWRLALGAGAIVYHRATVDVPAGLTAAGTETRAALGVAPEASWTWRRVEVTVGVDLVVGAPALVVQRGASTETLAEISSIQPRLGVAISY